MLPVSQSSFAGIGRESPTGLRLRQIGVWSFAAGVAASSFTFHRVLSRDLSENFYPEFAGVAVYLSDVMWIAGLCAWGMGRLMARNASLTVGPRPVFTALTVLTVLSFASISWAINPGQAAVTSFRRVLLLLGYIAIANESRGMLIPLVLLTAAAGLLHTVAAFGQVATGGPLDVQWIGELRPGWEGYGGIGRPEGYGLGFNPNPVGAAIAIPFVAILAGYLISDSSRNAGAGLLLLAVCLAAGMLVTVARGAILGSMIGLAAVFAVTLRSDWKRALLNVKRGIPTALLVVIAFCALALILGLSPGRWRFAPSSLSSAAVIQSASSRSQDLGVAKIVRESHSRLGVGAGNYPLAVKMKWFPSAWSQRVVPVHNVGVLLWSELGIVGLACWIALILAVALEIGRRLVRPQHGSRADSLIWTAPTLMVLAVSFFDFTPWATQDGRLAFIAVLGAWAGAVRAERGGDSRT
ncbi:MAG: O-antigen ligase family protein [Chloroflexi bacterium]|nr:O-antigen ligase family protein [Chloroflexota bacterium]